MSEIVDKNTESKSSSLAGLIDNLPVGLLIFNENEEIKFVNKSLTDFYIQGLDENILRKKIPDIEFLQENGIVEYLSSFEKGDSFEKELNTHKTPEGAEISLLVKGTPIFENGLYKGGVLLFEDLFLGAHLRKEKVFKSLYFRKLIDSLFSYFAITDPDGNILISSSVKNTEDKKYLKTKEANISQVAGGEFSSFFNDILSKLRKENDSRLEDSILIKENENNIQYKITAVPFNDSSGNLEFTAFLFRNISDELHLREKHEAEIKELKRYYDISNTITDAIVNIDLEGKITYWNDGAAELFGISRSEVFGKFVGKIIPSIDYNYLKILKDELKENKSFKGEFWTSDAHKESELLSVRMALAEEEGSIIILCTNITERANIEKQLRVSEERFRNIVTNTREYICTFDLNGDMTYVNPFFTKEFEYDENELLKLNIKDLIDFESSTITPEEIVKLYEQQSDSIEITLKKKSNSKVHVFANFTGAKDLAGNIGSYNAVFTDITEKKKAERDLLMIRTVFEASQDGIAVQSGGKYILVNDSFAGMFGYNFADEVIGKNVLDFVAVEDIPTVSKYIIDSEKGDRVPDRYVYKAKRKDESEFYVEKSTSSYETNDGLFIVSTYRDITKEKEAVDNLEISEERYRSITENINDCVWSAERKDGRLQMVFYSEVISRITGYQSQEFLKDSKLWLRIIHPNDTAGVVSKLRALYNDHVRNSDELEYRIINNLGSIVWIKNKVNILRDSEGVIQKVFGLTSDITLTKRANEELKKSTDELKVLNETKDRFISIISHDLRTPFSSILGFTDMLLSDRNMPEDKQIQYTTYIQESSRNMLSLVNGLLDWTRLQTGRISFEPQRINAAYVINKAIQMLSGVALQKNINLVSDMSKDVYIHADENLLFQVFNNLISNAIKFTDRGGNIVISASPLVKNRQVQFKVKDTGQGIKETDIPKLFKVDTKFTTTGTAGEKGSGLGLSLCYDIVKKHGGQIAVNSEYGKGSEFIFTIPVSSTKILLVDDSRHDRILYAKLLKNLVPDYTIVEATNGKEAIEKIRDLYPALVISDHDMPVMSGFSLIQQLNLSEIKLKPPVIILSSDLTDSIIKEYRQNGIEYAFKKPVNLTAFKFAVEKSLKKAIVS
ncbi:MAG: PAS domain S-box protein [Melioribacteraceae bacterium]|nr:PAS domain S-box protein [Melioribacteraceae bacterium]